MIVLICIVLIVVGASQSGWKQLVPETDIQVLNANKSSSVGDSKITFMRIDPQLWELVFAGISQQEEEGGKKGLEWCETHKFTAAINAGMFATDYETHVGYLKFKRSHR